MGQHVRHSPSGAPVIVAILDDNRIARDWLAARIGSIPGLASVVGDVADVGLLASVGPHVVLINDNLGDLDGVRVASSIRVMVPEARVIVLGITPEAANILDYLDAGVEGFVVRDSSLDDCVRTIRSVVWPPEISRAADTAAYTTSQRLMTTRDALDDARLGVRMTKREHEVISLIGSGLSNLQIAKRLDISAHTVKSHVRHVMEKLHVHTRLQISARTR